MNAGREWRHSGPWFGSGRRDYPMFVRRLSLVVWKFGDCLWVVRSLLSTREAESQVGSLKYCRSAMLAPYEFRHDWNMVELSDQAASKSDLDRIRYSIDSEVDVHEMKSWSLDHRSGLDFDASRLSPSEYSDDERVSEQTKDGNIIARMSQYQTETQAGDSGRGCCFVFLFNAIAT
ncbi:hypothetical protein SISSUDRAFT_1036462 [Sistotremastrum suecicum HHB10207 ss-3]|uniref:Uncharacterized protein n=1 Tax=Sistotremastrum suecicum HHB10207 ss-3 TaxID=1314776 RepID=A0A165ZE23_9AGAM|nr:hypothetical protein SISSUDRAFT_1036462 [Sistotremastrum suecicum HHB10207 ss-3]